VRRSSNWLLIGRRFVSRCAVRFFTRGTSSGKKLRSLSQIVGGLCF
jgi:hypothetical protein